MCDHDGFNCKGIGLIGAYADELAVELEQNRLLKELKPGE